MYNCSQSTSTDNDGRIPIAMGHLSDLGDLSDLDYYKVCLLNLFCILFKNKKNFYSRRLYMTNSKTNTCTGSRRPL